MGRANRRPPPGPAWKCRNANYSPNAERCQEHLSSTPQATQAAAGEPGTLGTGPVTDNAGLAFNRADAIAVPNAISGTGGVAVLGGGLVTLSGANSYAAGTQVAGSDVALASATPVGSGPVTLSGGGFQFTATAGFSAAYYNVVNNGYVPDFSGLTPVATRVDATIDFPDDASGFEPGVAGLNTTNCGAVDYPWSSFASHGEGRTDPLLDMLAGYDALGAYPAVRQRRWSAYVHQEPEETELAAIRRSNESGLPFGEPHWVDRLCRKLKLDLTIRPRGRPPAAGFEGVSQMATDAPAAGFESVSNPRS